jgi:hypothetical protein
VDLERGRELPDKNLVIGLDGSPSETLALITRRKKVSFIPTNSDQTVTVRFVGGKTPPFSDWSSSSKTAARGQALTGKVRPDAEGSFSYEARSAGVSGRIHRRPRPTASPQLIVDGGR